MQSESVRKRPALVPEADEVLVERAAAGDQRAFAQLYHRHARYLAGVVFRLMGDSSELEDVLQDTFLICLNCLNGLEQADRIRPWLVTIAVRRVQRRLAARSRRRWLSGQLSLVSAQSSDPHVSREVSELYRMLEGLSPTLRLPWTLARIEGGRLEEVAKWCDISLATLKRRLERADDYVKRRLGNG